MSLKKLTSFSGRKIDDKRVKKNTLLGILWDENNRVLLVKNPQGKIYLPGGSCKKFDSENPETAVKYKDYLQQFVYKKSGFLVKINDLLFFRLLNQSSKPIRVYSLQLVEKEPKNIRWRKTPGYKPIWLKPEEIQQNKFVSQAVKSIIKDLISENNLQSIKAL